MTRSEKNWLRVSFVAIVALLIGLGLWTKQIADDQQDDDRAAYVVPCEARKANIAETNEMRDATADFYEGLRDILTIGDPDVVALLDEVIARNRVEIEDPDCSYPPKETPE